MATLLLPTGQSRRPSRLTSLRSDFPRTDQRSQRQAAPLESTTRCAPSRAPTLFLRYRMYLGMPRSDGGIPLAPAQLRVANTGSAPRASPPTSSWPARHARRPRGEGLLENSHPVDPRARRRRGASLLHFSDTLLLGAQDG